MIDRRPEFNGTYPVRPLSGIQYLVIHHSGVDKDSTAESIDAYHKSLGWPGISYNWICHWNGLVEYVGDIGTFRYQVASRNHEVIGLCIPGNWNFRAPPGLALEATRATVATAWELLGRRVPVVGHKDIAYAPTACPGDTWPSWEDLVMPEKPILLERIDYIWGRAESLKKKRLSRQERLTAATEIQMQLIQLKFDLGLQ